jgi:hypothetical protein
MTDLQPAPLTDKIIGCAIEVHKRLGPGLLESGYESALCVQLDQHGLNLSLLSGIKTGLLINFNSRLLHQGIKRFVL